MPIRIFANVTLKYCHLYRNILMIFKLLLFIVVIIKLVSLEQLYLAVTLIVFVQRFHIFVCIVAHVGDKLCLFMNLRVVLYQLEMFASEVTSEVVTFSVGIYILLFIYFFSEADPPA